MKDWYVGAPARSTVVKIILDYSTRNGKFKRLEPHFQLSVTRSASKEGTETTAALPRSRECTKEPISAVPSYGSKGNFGAEAELWSVLQEKLRDRGGSSCRFDRKIGNSFFSCGQCNTGAATPTQAALGLSIVLNYNSPAMLPVPQGGSV